MVSLWKQGVTLSRFPALNGDRKVDVLVIGGGMAGILCAFQLKRAGLECLVAEAKRVCGGVTGNTTAKVTLQHGLIYHRLEKSRGKEAAMDYLRSNQRAMEEYRRLCSSIPCDFEEKDAYVYTRSDPEKLKQEQKTLNEIGCPVEWQNSVELPFGILGALRMPGQAQFHPLRFLEKLLPELDIYEDTMVRRVEGCTAITERGTIRAKKVVFCTHFPMINRRGAYFMKMYQHRSYVLALEGTPKLHGIYIDEAEGGLSFREAEGLLLLGGGGHRTGSQGGGWAELRRVARQYYPHSREVAHWAAQDCMTLDAVPYIGQYSPAAPNWYVATGFEKWGMTSSMVAALLLRELITTGKTNWGQVFDPARRMKALPLAANLGAATVSLLTPSLRRCPHMGCALKWNRQEHTWDCPCHGSRFTSEGGLVSGPALRDWDGAPKKEW